MWVSPVAIREEARNKRGGAVGAMSKKQETQSEKTRRIANAVRDVQLNGTAAWNDLDALSSKTLVNAIEVFEDEIRSVGDSFEGPINVHVTLQYQEDVTMSETFPGRFEGKWTANIPIIENVFVDTTSFYT